MLSLLLLLDFVLHLQFPVQLEFRSVELLLNGPMPHISLAYALILIQTSYDLMQVILRSTQMPLMPIHDFVWVGQLSLDF